MPSIGITTDSLLLIEGQTYFLKYKKDFPVAEYDFNLNHFEIMTTDSGQLTITRHNQSQRILAGRFWFKATSIFDQTKVEIRDGRFDIVY